MNTIPPPEFLSRPGEATDAPPGSSRKIRILMERAARRESLFHPHDNQKRVFGEEEQEEDDPLEYLDIDMAG